MSDYLQRCDKLYEIVKDFIDEQNIWGDECVYQNDRIIENVYPFITQLCRVVGYKELEDE